MTLSVLPVPSLYISYITRWSLVSVASRNSFHKGSCRTLEIHSTIMMCHMESGMCPKTRRQWVADKCNWLLTHCSACFLFLYIALLSRSFQVHAALRLTNLLSNKLGEWWYSISFSFFIDLLQFTGVLRKQIVSNSWLKPWTIWNIEDTLIALYTLYMDTIFEIF